MSGSDSYTVEPSSTSTSEEVAEGEKSRDPRLSYPVYCRTPTPTLFCLMENGEIPAPFNGVTSFGPFPFNEEDSFTDVELLVEGRRLFTNRSLLAFASPVFSCMFTDEFKEKNDKVIVLPEKDFVAVSEMLAFLHPGIHFRIARDSVFRLLPLAEEYQISVLKSACEEFLIKDVKNMLMPYDSFVLSCLIAAEKCGLSRLQELCADRMSEPDSPISELTMCEEVALETKTKIYQSRIAKLEKERTDTESWGQRVKAAKQRLRDIVLPHETHCRCHVELKLRPHSQRACAYCTRAWCSDNTSTEAYRNSYQFYCSHKIGYHIAHDATLRLFMDMVDHPTD